MVGLTLLARWIVSAATLWIGAQGPGHGRLLYLPALVVAAFLTGCLATAAILGLNLAFGGTIDSAFFWLVLRQVVNEGALLAIPAAGLGALGGYALRKARAGRLEPATMP
ncbi:MAG: hypothetical protein H0U90_02970 [Actinobacteria bacterium]|nr:hypothetical protein [Actinomycetota bacterium]